LFFSERDWAAAILVTERENEVVAGFIFFGSLFFSPRQYEKVEPP